MSWWRLVNTEGELLGQLLLPSYMSDILEKSKTVSCLFQEKMSVGDFSSLREMVPETVTIERITLYRVRRNDLQLVEGGLDLVERDDRIRFFPGLSFIQGRFLS